MALRLKFKLYLVFKVFLIWPLSAHQIHYLFKHGYSGHIRHSIITLSTPQVPLRDFAHAHSPGETPHPSRPKSNAISSPQTVSHSPVCPPNPLV